MKKLLDKIELKIRKRLLELELSRKKFITKIGMTEAGYKYMLDHNSMKIETLEKIISVLDVDFSYFTEEDSQNRIDNRVKCEKCIEKDKLIKAQEETISVYKVAMDSLHESYHTLRKEKYNENASLMDNKKEKVSCG